MPNLASARACLPFAQRPLPLVLLAALAMCPSAQAAQATANLQVQAQVVNVCSVSASTMNFGNYQPSAATDSTSVTSVSVLCNLGTTYTLSVDSGENGSGTTRRMKLSGGTDLLTYQVYSNIGLTNVLGITGATGISGVGSGLAVGTLLYGVVPKGQQVTGGTYTDKLIVTVDY